MRTITATIAVSMMSVWLVGTAQAAPVTIGSPLQGEVKSIGPTGLTATVANLGTAGPVAAPVSGAIVQWRLLGAKGGPFRLRVLRPRGGPNFTAVSSSPAVTALGPGLEAFPTALPVQAGDLIGLDVVPGQQVGTLVSSASTVAAWNPSLSDGESRPHTEAATGGFEFAFNAVVQPAPAVNVVSPSSGSFKGGTSVTISGADLTGATAVTFGGTPALFNVNSETQIVAVAPAANEPGPVPIAVTTVAGTATNPALTFDYQACIVPQLKGKKLKGAKKRIRKAGCKVGRVTKRDDATAKTGKVVRQGPKAWGKLAPGTKVNVTLGLQKRSAKTRTGGTAERRNATDYPPSGDLVRAGKA